jgi:invasion protein IalB
MAHPIQEVNYVTTPRLAALAAALLLSSAAASVQAQSTSVPTAAEPATQPAPVAAAKNGHNPDQVICKREETTGSRLEGHRTCYTRAQWEQMARDSADAMTTMQSRQINPSGH